VAPACANPPRVAASGRWTFGDAMVKLTGHESCRARRAPGDAEKGPSLGARKCGAFQRSRRTMLSLMDDVIGPLCETPDPKDGGLLRRKHGPTHRRRSQPMPVQLGKSNDTITSIAATAPSTLCRARRQSAWEQVKVTAGATAMTYAQCMRELVDVPYP